MLPDFKGVYDYKEVLEHHLYVGFDTDTAYYPLGIPLVPENPVIHTWAAMFMIHGGSKQSCWRRYEMLKTDNRYGQIGLFNVLQSLLFNASQSTGKEQAEFIDHFKWLWTHHCDKVFGRSEAQKYLLGQGISK